MDIFKGVILAVIIVMLVICTDHAISHRQAEIKPVEQGFHCVKDFKVDSKFNVVLKCNIIEN